jgi:hypothetical protein
MRECEDCRKYHERSYGPIPDDRWEEHCRECNEDRERNGSQWDWEISHLAWNRRGVVE